MVIRWYARCVFCVYFSRWHGCVHRVNDSCVTEFHHLLDMAVGNLNHNKLYMYNCSIGPTPCRLTACACAQHTPTHTHPQYDTPISLVGVCRVSRLIGVLCRYSRAFVSDSCRDRQLSRPTCVPVATTRCARVNGNARPSRARALHLGEERGIGESESLLRRRRVPESE